jgi:protoheme IX farnesyltransferase
VKAAPAALPAVRSRAADYLELAKPRVAVLVLFTVAAGGWMAALAGNDSGGSGSGVGLVLFHAVVGTALVAAGASALNQLLERHTDSLMARTENRPLPAGRLQPLEVLLFGLALGAAGLIYMAIFVRQPLTVAITAFTFVSYVWLYTPLKRFTTLNTLIGAVPGALPPVIGWTAVRGSLDTEAVVVFLILFLWQLPHFLAIAWIYRDDYARAGLRMVPVVDPTGSVTGWKMTGFCAALVLASLVPVFMLQAGLFYLIGAVLLGGLFLASTVAFLREASTRQARRVLRASLFYLPLLLALLLCEGMTGLDKEVGSFFGLY